MLQQTIEQRRAAYALGRVKGAVEPSGEGKKPRVNVKEFRSYARALPAMIRMNGLGQAAAFCRAKKGTYGELYKILSGWLTRDGQPLAGHGDLLEGMVASDMYRYRVSQAEALALMEWVRKLAVAFTPEAAENGDEGEAGNGS